MKSFRQFSAVMATFYSGEWHIDYAAETAITTDENEAIKWGHVFSDAGMLALYVEYLSDGQTQIMIEENGHLVFCPALN